MLWSQGSGVVHCWQDSSFCNTMVMLSLALFMTGAGGNELMRNSERASIAVAARSLQPTSLDGKMHLSSKCALSSSAVLRKSGTVNSCSASLSAKDSSLDTSSSASSALAAALVMRASGSPSSPKYSTSSWSVVNSRSRWLLAGP